MSYHNFSVVRKVSEEACVMGHHTTKKAAVIEALQEYIQKRKQLEILKLFNTIEYDEDFDYKTQRQQR